MTTSIRIPETQRGVALAVALVLLLVLTIIGVASMNTTTLEGKMATNLQENNQAFQAAESIVAESMEKGEMVAVNETKTAQKTYADAQANLISAFQRFSTPKRGSGYSAIKFQAAIFDMQSIGMAGNRARTEIHQGIYRIFNKPNN